MQRCDSAGNAASHSTPDPADRIRRIVAIIIRLPSYYVALFLTLSVAAGFEHESFRFTSPLIENVFLPVAALVWSLLAVTPFQLVYRMGFQRWFPVALLCAGCSVLWGMVATIRFEAPGYEGTIERMSQEHREKSLPPLAEYRADSTVIYRPFEFRGEHWILLPILFAPLVAFFIAPRRPASAIRSVT